MAGQAKIAQQHIHIGHRVKRKIGQDKKSLRISPTPKAIMKNCLVLNLFNVIGNGHDLWSPGEIRCDPECLSLRDHWRADGQLVACKGDVPFADGRWRDHKAVVLKRLESFLGSSIVFFANTYAFN